MSVLWSAARSACVMRCAFVLMHPEHGRCGQAGLQCLLLGRSTSAPTRRQGVPLSAIVRRALLCGLADGHFGLAHDLRLLARRRPAGHRSIWPTVSPNYRTPVAAIWTGAILPSFRLGPRSFRRRPSAYTIVVSCTVIFLFLSFAMPVALGLLAEGTPKWTELGPCDLGALVSSSFAVLSSCR